jgi:hypothetical protein
MTDAAQIAPAPNVHYRSACFERIHMVRWLTASVPSDFTAQMREMETHYRKVGSQLIHLAIIPQGCPTHGEASRAELRRLMPRLLEVCEDVHNVIEGQGFWASVIRSTIAGLVLASGVRKRVHVHEHATDVVQSISNKIGVPADRILHYAKLQAIIV